MKEKVSMPMWYQLMHNMLHRISKSGKTYTGIYGVPRGGTLVAVVMHDWLDLTLLEEPLEGCLVVDDLIDSGATRKKYKDYDFEVLIKKDSHKWIEFWYENTDQDTEDLIVRVAELAAGKSYNLMIIIGKIMNKFHELNPNVK